MTSMDPGTVTSMPASMPASMAESTTAKLMDMMSSAMTKVMTETTTMMTTTTESLDDESTTAGGEIPIVVLTQITGDIPEFEIILPCIFGIFVILSLSLMVFYTKKPDEDSKGGKVEGEGKGDGKADSSWF